MEQERLVQTLTIADSDSGGGAGVQADLKTFQMCDVLGTSAVTVVTAQDTLDVVVVYLVPTEVIRSRIEVARSDFQISALKLGMLETAEITECVTECLKECSFGPMAFGLVTIAKGGAPLLHDSAVVVIKRHLPLPADVLMSGLPGTQVLTGVDVENAQDAEHATRVLQDAGMKTVVIKDGHSDDSRDTQCADWVFLSDGEKLKLLGRRYPAPHTHDMGCTFPACAAAKLAKGFNTGNTVKTTRAYIAAAVANPLNISPGHGPVNHWAYRD